MTGQKKDAKRSSTTSAGRKRPSRKKAKKKATGARSTKAKPQKKKKNQKKKKGGGRYGNVIKPTYYGKRFDSKREGLRYLHLKALEIAGDIDELELQPIVTIVIGGVPVRYPTGKQMIYKGDFRYRIVATGERRLEDSKGHLTDVYKIKRALVYTMGITIHEV